MLVEERSIRLLVHGYDFAVWAVHARNGTARLILGEVYDVRGAGVIGPDLVDAKETVYLSRE